MPALLLELFSEEIPARMQAGAAASLARLVAEALSPLEPGDVQTFHGPRRIALAAAVEAQVPPLKTTERGPRANAPPQAVEGFLRKHGATRDQLADESGHWVLTKSNPAIAAETLVAQVLPPLLRRFPWPKSMRWGSSGFVWVRPLRRILCLLDGQTVPFTLAEGSDDGHQLASGNETEGHRFHAPGPFRVGSLAGWQDGLLERRVIPEAAERRRVIAEGVDRLAEAEALTVVPDEALLDEVANLVEWPVPLLGRIDGAFMDLPPEVMQVSMRVNQRYFALRDAEGRPAPRFAFAANIEAADGGAAIVAGNERVLRARFSDARHFWDLDRRTKLIDRVPALEGVTFHAKLGTQAARTRRLELLARTIAPHVGADPDLAARAARLAKADLTTGMVGEFPELQGVMGAYYAAQDGEPPAVAAAIREQYLPRGYGGPAPTEPVAVAVALAEKIEQLAAMFAIGERPSGSGDPYALRRAALGVIRIIRDHGIRRKLAEFIPESLGPLAVPVLPLFDFINERLRVQLRTEGFRHDVLAAVFADDPYDYIVKKIALARALSDFIASSDGADLLSGARRAENIVEIENRKDGPHGGPIDAALLTHPAEEELAASMNEAEPAVLTLTRNEQFTDALLALAALRPKLDAFFDDVTVNVADPALRKNRLALLAQVGGIMKIIAQFSRIER